MDGDDDGDGDGLPSESAASKEGVESVVGTAHVAEHIRRKGVFSAFSSNNSTAASSPAQDIMFAIFTNFD